MPTLAARCCAGQCGRTVPGGGSSRCPDCRRAVNRGSAAQQGYGLKWRRHRLSWLRLHPFCGERINGRLHPEHSLCWSAGLYVDAQRSGASMHVDHIEPIDGPNDPRFWLRTRWQTLCQRCHGQKSKREQRRRY